MPPEGGEQCPPNASLTADGTACECNDGFVPNAVLSECVADEPACPANASPATLGSACACNDGFEPDAAGDGCVPVEDEGNAGTQSRDRDDDSDEDEPGCAGATGATPLAAFAFVALLRRRRS